MAQVPVPNTLRFSTTFTHSVELQRCMLSFALTDDSGSIFQDFALTANSIFGALVNTLVHAASPETIWDGIIIEDVRVLPYGGIDFPQPPTPSDGAYGGPPLPMNVCLAIKRFTNMLGRSGRGRVYFPIWNENMLAGASAVGAAVSGTIITQLEAFQAAIESALTPAVLVVISTETLGSPRPVGITNPITGWAATDQVVDSQRRRLPGRGR